MTVQQEIVDTIKKYDKIIIHRHLRPDPDALGSQVGLAELLRESFPEKEIRQVGETIEGLRFLAEMQEVEDVFYQGALVIVTDTANSPRISDQRYQLAEKLIKIDHHPNDDPYGGIVGDTGRFLYPSTTSRTLEIASILRNYPFDASALNREIEQMPMKVAKLSGYLYQNIQVDENGAGRIILPQEILDKYGIDDSETASIVSLPGVIDEVLAWGIFVQQPSGYYRVRLRSKGPIINELAKRHHGGGHPLASGANAKDLAEVEEIYKEIQDICQSYKSRKTE